MSLQGGTIVAASPKEGRPAVVLQATSGSLSRQISSVSAAEEPEHSQSGSLGDGSHSHRIGEVSAGGGSLAADAGSGGGGGGPAISALSPEVEGMLGRLSSLPWRRVDVSFTGCRMPYTAHNLIQVTRRWVNFEGVGVPRHLAHQLAALDALDRVSGRQRDSASPQRGTALQTA
jgi:hypothetical protein